MGFPIFNHFRFFKRQFYVLNCYFFLTTWCQTGQVRQMWGTATALFILNISHDICLLCTKNTVFNCSRTKPMGLLLVNNIAHGCVHGLSPKWASLSIHGILNTASILDKNSNRVPLTDNCQWLEGWLSSKGSQKFFNTLPIYAFLSCLLSQSDHPGRFETQVP